MFRNKIAFILIFVFSTINLFAQTNPQQPPRSPLDPTVGAWFTTFRRRKTSSSKRTCRILKTRAASLTIDVYTPPDLKTGEKLPAVIFLNAIGDTPNGKVKHWEIYKSFPRLVAAHGMIGISMEADGDADSGKFALAV